MSLVLGPELIGPVRYVLAQFAAACRYGTVIPADDRRPRSLRNAPCPCGCGRKAKRCPLKRKR